MARDFDLIFSTLGLERNYIDAADRCPTQLTLTRRTQPAYPVVVARCANDAIGHKPKVRSPSPGAEGYVVGRAMRREAEEDWGKKKWR